MPGQIGEADRAGGEAGANFGFGVGADLAAVVVDEKLHGMKSAGFARERLTSNAERLTSNGREETNENLAKDL